MGLAVDGWMLHLQNRMDVKGFLRSGPIDKHDTAKKRFRLAYNADATEVKRMNVVVTPLIRSLKKDTTEEMQNYSENTDFFSLGSIKKPSIYTEILCTQHPDWQEIFQASIVFNVIDILGGDVVSISDKGRHNNSEYSACVDVSIRGQSSALHFIIYGEKDASENNMRFLASIKRIPHNACCGLCCC